MGRRNCFDFSIGIGIDFGFCVAVENDIQVSGSKFYAFLVSGHRNRLGTGVGSQFDLISVWMGLFCVFDERRHCTRFPRSKLYFGKYVDTVKSIC